MVNGLAYAYSGISICDSVRINKLVCNKYGLSACQYLVITVNQTSEIFPCGMISNFGELFFFSGYETL